MSEKKKKPKEATIDVSPIVEYVDTKFEKVGNQIVEVKTEITATLETKADKELVDSLKETVEHTPIPEGFVKETIKDDKGNDVVVIRPEKPLATEELVESSILAHAVPLTKAINKANLRLGLKEPETDKEKEIKKISEEFSETMNARDEQYRELLEQFQDRMLEAVWDTAYINDLPDSAFAYIEKGGKKGDEGRTTPKSLRHLPFKDASDAIDRTHLVNSLFMCETLDNVNKQGKEVARRKLCGAVDAYNRTHDDKIESAVCGTREARSALAETPLTYVPAVIERQGWTIQRLTERLEDATKRLVEFEDFMNTVVKPTHVKEGLNDPNNPPTKLTPAQKAEAERKKKVREMITGKKD